MILVIDNHDSFTFNLVQYLLELGAQVEVRESDAVDLAGIEALEPEAILLSPGPGRCEEAGVTLPCVRRFAERVPILGVCLGHQAIASAFGARVVRASRPMHGRTSAVHHEGGGILSGLPSPFVAARYHSLVVDPRTLVAPLEATAWTQDGEIMGLRHRDLPVFGVQFHPESFLSEHGHALLAAFLRVVAGRRGGGQGGLPRAVA